MNVSLGKISLFVILVVSLSLCGCTRKTTKPKSDLDRQMEALELPTAVEQSYRKSSELMEALSLNMKSFELTGSDEDYYKVAKTYNDLKFTYSDDELSAEGRKSCAGHKYQIDSLRNIARKLLEDNLSGYRRTLANEADKLVEEPVKYPVYLPKGTKLYLDFESSSPVVVRLLNADSHATLKTWSGKKAICDSLTISNGAIYLIDLQPKDNPYINLTLERSCKDLADVTRPYEVTEEEVPCRAGDFLARKVDGLAISSLFEEPRKVTLRSQGKAFFSGGSRSVVAMQVPANCTDIVYSLRISTSQSDQTTDGQFCQKVDEKYREIKFLGLPIYESHGTGSNIFRELLNATEPPREEEAYCNLYVFTNQAEAKKFSDGKPVAELKYNMDFSKQGTQSCNDRIPTKGIKTLYFGFENTRVRYSVYLWLESASTVKTTEYFKMKYSLEE